MFYQRDLDTNLLALEIFNRFDPGLADDHIAALAVIEEGDDLALAAITTLNNRRVVRIDQPSLRVKVLYELIIGFSIPDALPVLPLRDAVVLPLTAMPLAVGQPRSVRLVDDVMRGNRLLVLVAQRDANAEPTTPEALHSVGTVGTIHQLARSEAMTVGHQDHGGIAVTVPVPLGSLGQALDFRVRQILPGPQFSVRFRPDTDALL